MTGTTLLQLRDEPMHIALTGLRPGFAWRAASKRAFDFAVGLALSVLTLPIVALLALLSVGLFREWPLFVQDRIGKDGQRMRFLKIRTMSSRRIDPYAVKTEWSASDVPDVMRKVRDLHLDELPQLWLVVLGRLSMVGPRPRMPDEYEPVAPEYGQTREMISQGCTCLWQISPNTDLLPRDVPGYDYLYVVAGGLRLDLWILWSTGLQMLGLAGPREINDVPNWARSRGWYDLHISKAV